MDHHTTHRGRPRRGALLALALGAAALLAVPARAQDAHPDDLRLLGLTPAGPRSSLTGSWGTLQFTVTNPAGTARDARVAVFYRGRPDVQFSRDVWVPARSSISTWVAVGPAPDQPANSQGREIEILLYDRTGGADRLILPPGEGRVRSRPVLYRRREPTTAVMLDPRGDPALGQPSDQPGAEGLMLARALRQTIGLSDYVSLVQDGPLPTAPEAFDGIDVLVLAGNRLAADPPGRAAVRQWVERGGRLWVLLDLVDPATVAPVLGDDFDAAVVDRVGLTTLRLHREAENPAAAETREVEQPVTLVRVVPSAADQVLHVIDGWPASFVRRVGRGKVVVSALGPRAWYRPRTAADDAPVNRAPGTPAAPNPKGSTDLPVGLQSLRELGTELHPPPEPDLLPPDALRPLLTEEIGYSVVGRATAAALLGGFVLALAGLGLGLRRSRHPELVGWLGPAAAVLAAGLFVGLGQRSRQSVPPTVAVAELVDVAPGSGEAGVTGLYAVYHPSSGPADVGTRTGAILDLDTEGLEGQLRRRVQTDTDVWRWDGLTLPAGVRTGPFRATERTGRVAAVARFGPEGLEGRLEAGTFKDPADVVLLTPAREPVAVRLGPDGKFAATSADVLPEGQYLAGTVLSDRQQRRQGVYRQLLGGANLPRHLEGRDLLFAWAEPAGLPFTAEEGTRAIATALLTVPLEFERAPPDTRVTVPRGFLPYRRLVGGGLNLPTLASGLPVDQRLRFQLPAAALPMKVERATLFARVRAPGRKVSVAGVADGKPVKLFEAEAPTEPVRVDVTDARHLRLDDRGGLFLDVAVGAPPPGTGTETGWKIESLALEVTGRTEPR